jgi:hypothetical protein
VVFNRFSFLTHSSFICIPAINGLGAACFHRLSAEVTGRTTQIEVNADGTKTMKTGGTKTIYSWDTDKGGMSQKTETLHIFHAQVSQIALVLFFSNFVQYQ